eukprot:CAMPEP_0204269456 /NCGR_PEP_ID=MMETSP0468-20130131/16199_1 /ASSEMBLY_ACC=CAM_ASM_000383 /TAXON_ID=2969 /ORGANISM="Oxyrrhis marina" /LENGTH=40 /DNA_ID= /DNA_START= /DNA_END= /DNA_ORIENTATION=
MPGRQTLRRRAMATQLPTGGGVTLPAPPPQECLPADRYAA